MSTVKYDIIRKAVSAEVYSQFKFQRYKHRRQKDRSTQNKHCRESYKAPSLLSWRCSDIQETLHAPSGRRLPDKHCINTKL